MFQKAFVIIFLLLASCSKSDDSGQILPDGTNFRVNYFTTSCVGVTQQDCLLIQEGETLGTDDWDYFYTTINGFDFEPGFIYNLEVKKTDIPDPLQDASSIRYELIRLIAKVAVRCEFLDATRDLDWLRFEIQKREANINDETKYCYITRAELNSETVFAYWDCNPVINKVTPVYDCLGSFLGFMGGEIAQNDLRNQSIVWRPEDFVCQPNF